METSRATEPTGKSWLDMNYGPFLTASVEAPLPPGNIAYKGLALRVGGSTRDAVSRGDCATMAFDTDLLRYSVAWTGGFLSMRSIVWDGSHGTHPKLRGETTFVNRVGPGWAPSGDEKNFRDPRELPYGPLPRDWAHYKGLYLHGDQVILSYTVGESKVLELPGLLRGWGVSVFTRTINVDRMPASKTVAVCETEGLQASILDSRTLRATEREGDPNARIVVFSSGSELSLEAEELPGDVLAVGCVGAPAGAQWRLQDRALRLQIPESAGPLKWRLALWRGPARELPSFLLQLGRTAATQDLDLEPLTHGGPPRWPERLETVGQPGPETEAYTVDTIPLPADNPWNANVRVGGFDFFQDDSRAAVAAWDGDVWLLSGIGSSPEKVTWQRIASGLFQPLGLKIVDGKIYVLGRDQITVPEDLNGDGEADFYRNFNNDAQVTEHFHEFAMDLQTDAAGDFFYMKGGRHAKDSVVPQHGSLLKVSKDGEKTEFVAYGFRAPNGLCINDDGTFFSSDQEGHWTPMNRINYIKPGGFYGYMWAYHRGKIPESYDKPLCWIHKTFDRSPSAQVWVKSKRWGPLEGRLLALSYGTGNIEVVPHEFVDGQVQGGVSLMPIKMFPTGIQRGRFRESDGQLYIAGLFGWAGNRTQPGGLFRVRYTNKPVHVPVELKATKTGLRITFSGELDPKSARPGRLSVERWNYQWRQKYGSSSFRVSDGESGTDKVAVSSVQISKDRRSLFVEIPDMVPCMQMRIGYRLAAANGKPVRAEIYSTVHALGVDSDHQQLFGN